MLKKRWDKSRLPSRHVTEGPGRAPHRSYYHAMGLTDEQISQPFVGVATCWNEAAPCNIALNRQAQSVKAGVSEAGGTPREFTTITVTDGIAMGHQGMKSSLVSREVIADSVELTMRGHCYDALVGLAGCDKSLPGMMMAMLRLNVPSAFIYGGSILPGQWQGREVTVQDIFEAVGQHSAEDIAASFQQAVVDCLVDRTVRALAQAGEVTALVVAGGVAANGAVRAALEGLAASRGLRFVAPPAWLCTDNAAMIAWAGAERFAAGLTDPLDTPARARWPLDPGAEAVRGAGVKA